MSETKARVLVVDDEERNRRLLEAMLQPMGCEVSVVSGGREALERLRASPPDLVLLDVIMPDVSGLDVLRAIKADVDLRQIPVVMVSALREVDDRVTAYEMGADDFLSKPLESVELKARVRSLLKVKQYHDHLRHYRRELEDEVVRRTGEVRETLAALEVASLDSIHCLAAAAEYRDDATGAHIHRMSRYASALAGELDLDARLILYAAPMHDIGKIGVPDRILLKSGPLDEAEWAIMRQHPEIGARILSVSQSKFVKVGRVIALTHHEKWDGSGYPQGLAGEAIPLEGRVCAIADVFDALTSVRPYRKAFSVDEGFAAIRAGIGRHFDPAAAVVFLAMRARILELRDAYQDDGESHLWRTALAGDGRPQEGAT